VYGNTPRLQEVARVLCFLHKKNPPVFLRRILEAFVEKRLPLCPLEALTGTLLPIFLALLGARIACEKTPLRSV
jgi:hypothetical protein